MAAELRTPLIVLPGTTPLQRATCATMYTATNAGVCSLTGHLFSLVSPAAGAIFGAAAALIGLSLASYLALNSIQDCKDMNDLADRIAKTIMSFFAGGGLAFLATNAAKFPITFPAALILMGPVLTTSMAFLVLTIACFAASRFAQKGAHALESVREQIRQTLENAKCEMQNAN